jgi:hypothetical protein
MAVTAGALTLHQALAKQSLWTGEQIFHGYQYGIPQHETTLTDVNLLMIHRELQGSGLALVTTFTNESQTGADWGWQIGGTKLLIQAKVIDPATQSYPRLDHRVGFGGPLQVDLLIQTATQQGAQPLYVFYNGAAGNADDNGCYIAPASEVKTLIDMSINAQITGDISKTWQAIKPISKPWEHLAAFAQGL